MAPIGRLGRSGPLLDVPPTDRTGKASVTFKRLSGEKLTRNLAFAGALIPIAERHSTSVAAVAIAWTLAWPGVTGAIVGARSPAQVDGWLDAASLELTGRDLAEIAAAIEATGAGSGPLQSEK
ncbi:aldo/keto reductase [Mesorhizobium sp. M0701]|uniref:aldo/keto reductase n=1 Tax=Mesorhizobium sp. M0701 TaxID=2956989 RepID=UPI00333CC5EC